MTELDNVLGHYPSDCRPSFVEPLGNAGGMSGARFWRLQAPRGLLVLRRWPPEHPTPERLRLVHSVLRHAAQRGIDFLPVPLVTNDNATFVADTGHLWELAPWLPGVADYWQTQRRGKLRAAMTALAEMHRATSDFPLTTQFAGPNAVARRLAQLRDIGSTAATLAGSITDSDLPELATLARRFVAVLPRAVPLAIGCLEPLANVSLPLQPCLRDIWHDHVLFDGDRVAGFVDFGAIDVDTPATDIARLIGSLVEDDAPGWREGLAAYSAVRPLTENDTLTIVALDRAGTVLAGCNWLRWIYVDGRRFESRPQVVERLTRICDRVDVVVERA